MSIRKNAFFMSALVLAFVGAPIAMADELSDVIQQGNTIQQTDAIELAAVTQQMPVTQQASVVVAKKVVAPPVPVAIQQQPVVNQKPAEPTLTQQLNQLSVPANEVPGPVDMEKLYSVQDRYVPVKGRFEVNTQAGQKVTDTGFISTKEVGLGIRYYFSSHWSLGANYTFAFNEFGSATNSLFKKEGILPEVPYLINRSELSLRFMPFYGKFRLSMDKVLYFDHFISIGPSMLTFDTGSTIGAMAETGFVFWFGKNWNALMGIKGYFYNKISSSGETEFSQHAVMNFSVGYLFGG